MPGVESHSDRLVPSLPTQRSSVEQLHALHDQVLRGDPLAADCVATTLIRRVKSIVCARRRGADVATSEQAILDAVADYLIQPARFDPTRSSLLTWTAMAAIRNIDDYRRAETRRNVAEAAAAREWDRVRSQNTGGPRHNLASLLRSVRLRDADKDFVVAWLTGRTGKLAEILGVSGLPEPSQKRAVGRAKERLRLRLKRALANR